MTALDNFLTGRPQNVEHLTARHGFRLISIDVIEYVHVVGDVDEVLHFASPASPLDYLNCPIATLKVGSIGTLHALGLAKKKVARSCSPAPARPTVTRGRTCSRRAPGATSTLSARAASTTRPSGSPRRRRWPTGAPTTSTPPSCGSSNIRGPRMSPKDGRAIPAFATQALAGKPITVAGDGSQTRSIIYVDDLVEGIVRLLRSGHQGPMNIGNPHEVSIQYLAEAIRDLIRIGSKITYIPRPEDDPTIRQPDSTLARAELGWEPEIEFTDGLTRTVDHFQQSLDGTTR